MIGFLIALLSGTLMSVQGVFNTRVTDNSSMWVANAFVQFTAFLVCISAWIITDRTSFKTLLTVEPKYCLLGGVMGAFITLTVIKSMEALGPAKAVMLIVIAQLIVAYLIEIFGMFGVDKQPFSWRKAIGGLIAIGGFVIFKWEK
ncbi:MAG: DMT family transporter [Lachnospiraceae bacterium]|nr:DMT family transporter [Lachnospiraceae bacterium]MBQ5852038.1 DMT family transporter [Lachnospiraceae bacterium]MEE1255919.1 DMT family transporter [Lachnospiraceae bacterium]MEE1303407.1 DMT family transporter [Bacteroidales bacterium]